MTPTLYSAIYGRGYDSVKDVHDAGCRTVLFTDDPELVPFAIELHGWTRVIVDPLEHLPSPMLRAKWWKCRPDLALPDDDVTLWIDGSMTPLPGYAGRCVDALGDDDLALTPHPWRDCIYDELDASVGLPKYDAIAMVSQVRGYRAAGHPEHWGLFATGAIARRAAPAVGRLGRAWWRECLERSWQDQLSLPVLVRNAGDLRWNTALPWADWWGYLDHGVGT